MSPIPRFGGLVDRSLLDSFEPSIDDVRDGCGPIATVTDADGNYLQPIEWGASPEVHRRG